MRQWLFLTMLLFVISTALQASEQKVVLISGGTRGIGLATAKLLTESGCKVYATARSLDNKLLTENEAIHFDVMDVTDDKAIKRVVDHIIALEGKIDILINNAGYGLGGPVESLEMAQLQAQFEVNFFGAIRLCQAVLPHMRARVQGRIINISSFQGVWGLPYGSAYSASKAALEVTSEALSLELLPFNIHVSIIEPGHTATQFHTEMGTKIEGLQAYDQISKKIRELSETKKSDPDALGPTQTADEVAKAILEVINDPSPKLRYQTSFESADMVELKLKDKDGTAYTSFIRALFAGLGINPSAP